MFIGKQKQQNRFSLTNIKGVFCIKQYALFYYQHRIKTFKIAKTEKSKPVVRLGRKTSGPKNLMIAGLPVEGYLSRQASPYIQAGFFYCMVYTRNIL